MGCPGKLSREICQFVLRFDLCRLALFSMRTNLSWNTTSKYAPPFPASLLRGNAAPPFDDEAMAALDYILTIPVFSQGVPKNPLKSASVEIYSKIIV